MYFTQLILLKYTAVSKILSLGFCPVSTKNLKHSNAVIEFYVKENLIKNTFFSNKSKKIIINEIFFQQPFEVVFRAFSESIKLIGKKYYFVRGKKIAKIISDIDNNKFFKATLGGCIIEKVNQTVIISKE